MQTTQRLKELARRSGKAISLIGGKEGFAVRIDGREYKITAEQYDSLLDWLLVSTSTPGTE